MLGKKLALLVLELLLVFPIAAHHLAVFKNPVADLTLQPQTFYNQATRLGAKAYSPESGRSVLRTFQGIFNEVVDVVDEIVRSDDILVTFFNHFYFETESGTNRSSYWTKRDQVIFLEELEKRGLDVKTFIPKPLSTKKEQLPLFRNNEKEQKILTLIEPWFEEKTGRTYSAGTRFVAKKNGIDGTVVLLDPSTYEVITAVIPQGLFFEGAFSSKKDDLIGYFIKLLKQWAKNTPLVIPYVWGGMSYVSRVPYDSAELEGIPGKATYWTRPTAGQDIPFGMCCSTLVLRAAQAVGLPYYFSTTWTALRLIRSLRPGEHIEPGDIIWLAYRDGPWAHLQVCTGPDDYGRDALVEAAGYSSDFGCIGEIALENRFDGVKSYKDLEELFWANGTLYLFSATKEERYAMKSFKILKIKSLWE